MARVYINKSVQLHNNGFYYVPSSWQYDVSNQWWICSTST